MAPVHACEVIELDVRDSNVGHSPLRQSLPEDHKGGLRISRSAADAERQLGRDQMGRIEQAVFTSARTDRGAGYQVVATSPGIGDAVRRQLAIWGPSHDSLLEKGADAASFNFFPLSDASFCISRTTSFGWEYSGRGGARVYTHCLIVPAEVLRQFANHPLALAWAAAASGAFEVRADVPSVLQALDLSGTAPSVHQASLAQLVQRVGAGNMSMLVESVLTAACTVAGIGGASAEQLIAGLLDCLPLECRTAISFSTGLRYSSRRPFRLLSLSSDPATRRRLARQPNITVLDMLARKPRGNVLRNNWARLIERVLCNDQIGFLADELSPSRPDLRLSDLPGVALRLLEELETISPVEPLGRG